MIIVEIITLIILFFISSVIPVFSVKINERWGNLSWINENPGSQSITIERYAPISGNASFRVDVRPSDVPDKRFNSSWSIVSTDFIAIRNDGHYNYSLDVSAKDVNQLHAKIYYYDSSKMEIPWEEYIFGGKDGSFKGTFTFDSAPQRQATYLKFQMWVRQNVKPSSYLIDNIIIAEDTRRSPPIQNSTIFSETFEGSVKIIQNSTALLVRDSGLMIEKVVTGLDFPTSMAFLGPDDILVLEKNTGSVRRIVNGSLLPKPVLDVNVGTMNDRGMLGMDLSGDNKADTNVFVYYTEASAKDASDVIESVTNKNYTHESKEPLANRLYSYKWMNDRLINPKLLIEIPAKLVGEKNLGLHNGGKVIIGPDDNIYLVIGDIGGYRTETQNILTKAPLNATSVIIRISQEGEAIDDILGSKDPVNKFFAYGIRNSFGMDFDPVTGNLWDTENGPGSDDEINLVKPGFNSGWSKVMGSSSEGSNLNLVTYGGKGKYSNPEFVWNHPVAPTALKFFNSDKFGKEYENDIFVGDFNNGTLYHFHLNDDRTSLDLAGPLADRISNFSAELEEVTFGTGFGSITDLQVGPDGYLYVVSLQEEDGTPYPYHENAIGTIFRIRPWNIT